MEKLFIDCPHTDYYCTWQVMEWLPDHTPDKTLTVRDILSHEGLFGENGIAVSMHEEPRGDLIFLVDDGWDLRDSCGKTREESEWFRPYVGGCQIGADKFPNYGNTPAERLKTLSDNVKKLGWRGLGLWISPTVAYAEEIEDKDADFKEYWSRRLSWSLSANVLYWKIDWGDYDISDKHKALLYDLKKEIYPSLLLENAFIRAPLNKRGREGLFTQAASRFRLGYSDIFRTYDVTYPLSIPTTLSRVASLLRYPTKSGGYINAEDELYLSSALGLSFGVMRYGIGDAPATSPPNVAYGGSGVFPTTRPARKQLDEVIRAVNLHKIAPPFRANIGATYLSKEKNTDRWKFTPDQSWKPYCKKEFIAQSAPRIIARNVNPPVFTDQSALYTAERHSAKAVDTTDTMPYLAASRNPNGTLVIAALGRVTPEKGYFKAPADVRWEVGAIGGDLAVLGYFSRLTVYFDESLTGRKIYASDLKRLENGGIETKNSDGFPPDNSTETRGIEREITDLVSPDGHALVIDGEFIEQLCKNSVGDCSEPAVLIRFEGEKSVPPVSAAIPKTPPFYRTFTLALKLAAAVFVKIKEKKHEK
ncbi:MAG: hypothetical protein LBT20_01375, partial [Clostridiales bacterium]|nr:hypothetical protein [Clostridiales bacterium]